jgi:uncharacterized protein (TIGR03435 family)
MSVSIQPALLLLAASAALLQTPNPPAFEAASLKVNTSGSGSTGSHDTTGQLVFDNMPLDRVLAQAYGVRPPEIVGPSWLGELHVDIVAKYPPQADSETRMLMLRGLLEERFKLAAHREKRDLPGFAMVVAKGGFKLKPVESGSHTTHHEGGRVQSVVATSTSMEFLAGLVTRYLGQIVVDKTGIDGVFDFDLRWTNEERSTGRDALPDPVPTLPDALEERLGLRLQPQKVSTEVVVVDHLERMPISN